MPCLWIKPRAHRLPWPTFSISIFPCSWQILPLYITFHLKLEKYFMDEEIGKLRTEWTLNTLYLQTHEQTENIQHPKPLPPPSESNNGEPVAWTLTCYLTWWLIDCNSSKTISVCFLYKVALYMKLSLKVWRAQLHKDFADSQEYLWPWCLLN